MPVYTVKFPLIVVSKRDTFDVIDENNIEEVVRFNLKSTILSCPGERRSDPDFGVCAKSFLFEGQDSNFTSLRETMLKQIRKYVPYCEIRQLIVNVPENNPNALHIIINYSIPDIKKDDIFELILSE